MNRQEFEIEVKREAAECAQLYAIWSRWDRAWMIILSGGMLFTSFLSLVGAVAHSYLFQSTYIVATVYIYLWRREHIKSASGTYKFLELRDRALKCLEQK